MPFKLDKSGNLGYNIEKLVAKEIKKIVEAKC